MSTVEETAREAAEVYAVRCWPDSDHCGAPCSYSEWYSDVRHNRESGFEDGYLAGHASRDEEVAKREALWRELVFVMDDWELGTEPDFDRIAELRAALGIEAKR